MRGLIKEKFLIEGHISERKNQSSCWGTREFKDRLSKKRKWDPAVNMESISL